MTFARALDRVQADFIEMPGLELTLPQAVRLWNLGMDECCVVLEALADAGFLKWTARRTIIRTGRPPAMGLELQPSRVAARRPPSGDNSVG